MNTITKYIHHIHGYCLVFLKDAGVKNSTMNESSTEWAEEQYGKGILILNHISPVTNLSNLEQGDVLASTSGNLRLVLDIQATSQTNGHVVSFLSLLRDGIISLESAALNKISTSKLSALIKRRNGNPLIKYSTVTRNLKIELAVLNNIQVLLKAGPLGAKLQSKIAALKYNNNNQFGYVDMWASSNTGTIESVDDEQPNQNSVKVSFQYNLLDLPKDDYIKSARYSVDNLPEMKDNILAACVIANTIANAKNLLNFAKLAGKSIY